MTKKLNALIKPLLALTIALVAAWLILAVAGYNAGDAFGALWKASFKNLKTVGTMLNRTSPILFTGLSVAVALQANMMNIGAEGQFLGGAIAATVIGIYCDGLPGPALIALMAVGGALGGAIVGAIPGFLKARMNVSEVIITIMLNYVFQYVVEFLVRGPLKDTSQGEPQSWKIAEQAYLPYLLEGTKLHMGFFLGVAVAILVFILLFKTYIGFELRAVGFNLTAAQTTGINAKSTMVFSMVLAGALAGIGGAIEIGNNHYLIDTLSPGYGFTAIAVSALAGNNPIGVIFTAMIFGFLSAGSTAMQRSAGISATFVQVFQGLIVIFVAIAAVRSVKKKRLGKKAAAAKGGSK